MKFEVNDTQKKLGDLIVHYGRVTEGSIKLDDVVSLKINTQRRKNMRAYQSATHLLHESLRRVLGTHVTQKGSLVEPNRLRFDFSHSKPIDEKKLQDIEDEVNNRILSNYCDKFSLNLFKICFFFVEINALSGTCRQISAH